MKGCKNDGLDGEHPMKDRWELLPIECVEDVVKILTFGAKKYGPNSWQGVEEDRYYAALMRHLSASRQGELNDPESGLSHMAHAMCNVIFLLWFEKHKNKAKKDFITPFKYRGKLGEGADKSSSGNYIIYHKGKKLEISNDEFEFQSEHMLTNEEFLEIVEGTRGIKRIYGQFKLDN
jgi:hypothetical protein